MSIEKLKKYQKDQFTKNSQNDKDDKHALKPVIRVCLIDEYGKPAPPSARRAPCFPPIGFKGGYPSESAGPAYGYGSGLKKYP